MRALTVILSGLVTAYKGVKLVKPHDADSRRMSRNCYGWSSEAMSEPWRRVAFARTPHTLTNLMVEWNRSDAQRGAKLMLGLTGLVSLVGLAEFAALTLLLLGAV